MRKVFIRSLLVGVLSKKDEEWISTLNQANYTLHDSAISLFTGGELLFWEKTISSDVGTKQISNYISWEKGTHEGSFGEISESHGIFLRKNGKVKGGFFFDIDTESVIPNAHLHTFCIDPKYRGLGLGSMMMNYAQTLIKDRGVKFIELENADYQAPEFYEKLGFKKVVTYKAAIFDRLGSPHNAYVLRKEI